MLQFIYLQLKDLKTRVYLIVLFFITTVQSVAQNCPATSCYFTIDSATRLTEHAGVYGGGSVVHYRMFCTVKSKKLQYFDSAWAYGGKALVILKGTKNVPEKSKYFTKNQHFELQISIAYNHDPAPDMKGSEVFKKPLDCKDELILRFTAKRKNHYIVRSKFIRIDTINLP